MALTRQVSVLDVLIIEPCTYTEGPGKKALEVHQQFLCEQLWQEKGYPRRVQVWD